MLKTYTKCQSACNTFHPSASNFFHTIGLPRTIFTMFKSIRTIPCFQNLSMISIKTLQIPPAKTPDRDTLGCKLLDAVSTPNLESIAR